MSRYIDIKDLSSEITKQLNRYSKIFKEELEELEDVITRDALKDIKNNIGAQGIVLTGDYQRGWRRMKTTNGYVIYNETDYQLTHLLEKGHDGYALKNGGRTEGAPAYPHIGPAEEIAVRRFEKGIRKLAKE